MGDNNNLKKIETVLELIECIFKDRKVLYIGDDGNNVEYVFDIQHPEIKKDYFINTFEFETKCTIQEFIKLNAFLEYLYTQYRWFFNQEENPPKEFLFPSLRKLYYEV